MAIPDYQTLMLPLLQYAGVKKELSNREAIEYLCNEFNLTDREIRELLPSGRQSTIDNRVGWARTYMKKAGLLESTRRGFFSITKRGEKVLKQNPSKIGVRFLSQFPEFVEFRSVRRDITQKRDESEIVSSETPEETLESAYQKLRVDLALEIIQTLSKCSPSFFEKLVVDVLVKMGYGGSRKEAGQAIGKTADGGIDGIINEDRLGLDIIYIQAKRWDGVVGRPEIQKFAGALQGQRAKKGIFLTTSNFSKEASEYVTRIDSKIILIDGDTLANLMIDHNVGVSTVAQYEIKRIDTDYFTED